MAKSKQAASDNEPGKELYNVPGHLDEASGSLVGTGYGDGYGVEDGRSGIAGYGDDDVSGEDDSGYASGLTTGLRVTCLKTSW